jgi:hypothetical protein
MGRLNPVARADFLYGNRKIIAYCTFGEREFSGNFQYTGTLGGSGKYFTFTLAKRVVPFTKGRSAP